MPLAPLPIDPLLPEVVASLRRTPRLVLEAPPGAGKTTRLPRALLDAGLLDAGDVVVLQPRRLAARMAAARVAEELGEQVGGTAGYQVRFDERTSARTRVRFVTEGVLTRRLLRDRELRGTGTVILDEFHERHLEGDLALALLLRLTRTSRPDLRLVVMSATLDAAAVAEHLEAPRLRSEGRRFEVAIEHAELEDSRPLDVRVAAAVRRLVVRGLDGHVLVFLPGAAEIRRAMEACRELAATRTDLLLLPLHGELPPAEQDRAVRPCRERKLVFTTNVAETSVTIDGVAAVIDSGLHRRASFSAWSGLPSLGLAKVSQASAAQRAGRAGRTRDGLCLRLYTRHDHDARPAADSPEIGRTDLASLVLTAAALGAGDLDALPWLEPPPAVAVEAARSLLARLDALDPSGTPTATGRAMLRLPAHPRLARLVVEAARAGEPERGAALAAVVSERDLRARRGIEGGRDDAWAEATDSDVLRLAELLDVARDHDFAGPPLRSRGIDPAAARAADRAARQLARAAHEVETTAGAPPATDPLRWLLLAFPDRVAQRRGATAERRKGAGVDLVLCDGTTATLGRESTVRDAAFLVAVEAEERGGDRRPGAGRPAAVVVRTASAIEPDWLLDLVPSQVQEVTEVRWDATAERALGTSRLVYGALVLDESAARGAPTAAESAVLAQAALAAGPRRFVEGEALDALLERARFAAGLDRSIRAPTDDDVREALGELCAGRRSFAELARADLVGALWGRMGPAARARVEALAPERVRVGARSARVRYERDRPPWVESRLQDFFGAREGPRVGGGATPLVLHLLAPNGRAVQVTTDLAGFWDRHYASVRRELMRRYPKHAWPEDPRTAEPPAPRQGRPR